MEKKERISNTTEFNIYLYYISDGSCSVFSEAGEAGDTVYVADTEPTMSYRVFSINSDNTLENANKDTPPQVTS